MKDTTFHPTKEQLARLASSYKSNKDKTDFVECKVTQLWYPLDNLQRQPMPAGGLFSTANDVLIFCQMLANGGIYKNSRILTEKSIKIMTQKQTGSNIKNKYGFGFDAGNENYGHGGAYGTNMCVFRNKDLIEIFMEQRNGEFPNGGNNALNLFRKAALKIQNN